MALADTLIAVPSEGRVHQATMDSIHRMIRGTRCADRIELAWENAYPAGFCRNRLVRRFLADPSWTHILLVDTDMVVPADGLDQLLAVNAPIVSGPAPICAKSEGPQPRPLLTTNVMFHRDPALRDADLDPTGPAHPWRHMGLLEMPAEPFTCDSTGLAFLLIRREVLERMAPPWFHFIEHADGTKLAVDTYFFRKARKLGYELTIQPKALCDHIKPVDVTHVEDLLGGRAFRSAWRGADAIIPRTLVVVCKRDNWLSLPLAEVLLYWQQAYGDRVEIRHAESINPIDALRDSLQQPDQAWERLLLIGPDILPHRNTLADLASANTDVAAALSRRMLDNSFVYAFRQRDPNGRLLPRPYAPPAELRRGPIAVNQLDVSCLLLSQQAVNPCRAMVEHRSAARHEDPQEAAFAHQCDVLGVKQFVVPTTVSRWTDLGLLGLLQLKEREGYHQRRGTNACKPAHYEAYSTAHSATADLQNTEPAQSNRSAGRHYLPKSLS